MNAWELNLALSSYEARRAIQRRMRTDVRLSDDLLVICPLSMAGEDPSLHAVLVGMRGSSPQLLVSPDPRSPRSRLEMLSRLKAVIEPHILSCVEKTGALPQIVVPSSSARDVILGLADWLPYIRDPKEGGAKVKGWTEDARVLGMLLQLYAQRSDLAGQQLLLVASEILSGHFAFGQELRGHLGAQLTWIDPPEEGELLVSAAQAEAQPMGSRTDAHLDIERLSPALDDWAKVERGGSRSLASFRRQEIEDILREVLDPIWQAVGRALNAVEDLSLAELSAVDELWQRDRYAFKRHMEHMEDGGRFSRRDTPVRAAFVLAEAEDAIQQLDASRLWEDPLRLSEARIEGEVLSGVSRNLPSEEEDFVVIESNQRWLRIRIGDELEWMQGKARGVVREITRKGAVTRVLLKVNALPDDGLPADWAPEPPDWYRLAGERGNLSRALDGLPDTHREPEEGGEAPQAPEWKDGMDDPLAVLEEMR